MSGTGTLISKREDAFAIDSGQRRTHHRSDPPHPLPIVPPPTGLSALVQGFLHDPIRAHGQNGEEVPGSWLRKVRCGGPSRDTRSMCASHLIPTTTPANFVIWADEKTSIQARCSGS